MTRQELTAVRDIIDALLRCPDHVRELLTQWIAPQARWLAPEARSKERTVPLIFSKPNGRDPHPPPIASPETPSETKEVSPRRSPTSHAGKPPRLSEGPRATASSRDAGAFGRERECAGEGRRRKSLQHRRAPARARLARGGHEGQRRSLAACGGTCGRGRGPHAAAVELTAGPEPELLDPRPADAHAPWLKPLNSHDRRERREFQVTRFG